MPRSRKTKAKYKDFQKVKLKVGKTLPKGANETTTSFKSRGIHLKEQLASSSGQPTTRRKQNINDLLTQCHHYSASVRLDAVTGLRELLGANPAVLHSHTAAVIHKMAELCLDKDPTVRQALLRLLKHVMPLISTNQMAPFFPVLSTHLCCAMTHIYDDIQIDSLALLDLCLEHYPGLSTDRSSNLLPNFIEQISRQNQTGSGKGNSDFVARSLLVNPNSKLSSQKWRVKVLNRLTKFLQAVVSQQQQQKSGNSRRTENKHRDMGIGRGVIGLNVSWDEIAHGVTVLPTDAVRCALGQGFTLGSAADTTTSSTTRGADCADAFTSIDQLKSFIDIIVPLLIQCWVEAGPAQLTSKLPGNVLSPDAIAMLSGVLGILKLLLQCVRLHSNGPGQQLVDWVTGRYENNIVRHLLPAFPYEMHRKMAPQGRRGNKKTSEDTTEISTLTLNLVACEILSNFLNERSLSTQKEKGNWFKRTKQYVTKTLKERSLSGEDLNSALVFVTKLLDLPLNIDVVSDVLEGVYVCYMSKNMTSPDKMTSLDFFSRLLNANNNDIIRSEPVQKWMESLPKLLTSQRSGSFKSSKVMEVIKVIQRVGVQGHPSFLTSLQEQSTSIFDALLRADSWEQLQRATVELLEILPRIERRHLQYFTETILSGDVSLSLTRYLVNIITYRYNRDLNKPKDCCLATDDLVSFLFSLALGTKSTELSEITPSDQPNNNSVTITTDPQHVKGWRHRKNVSKIGCGGVNQLHTSDEVWAMYSEYTENLLSHSPVLPVHTALCALQGLCHVDQKHVTDHSIIAHCVWSLVRISPTEGDAEAEALSTCARDTCFDVLAGNSKVMKSFWDCAEQNLKSGKDLNTDSALRLCTCLSAMFDHVPLTSSVTTWVGSMRGVSQEMKKLVGPEIEQHKEWSELQYKISLIK